MLPLLLLVGASKAPWPPVQGILCKSISRVRVPQLKRDYSVCELVWIRSWLGPCRKQMHQLADRHAKCHDASSYMRGGKDVLLSRFQRWQLLVELVTPCTVATSFSSLAALHALMCCAFFLRASQQYDSGDREASDPC